MCDRRFVWNYGLGLIRPRTPFLGGYVKRGYLHQAMTLAELAAKIGVDPEGLADTVGAANRYAREGADPEFGEGGNPYDLNNGAIKCKLLIYKLASDPSVYTQSTKQDHRGPRNRTRQHHPAQRAAEPHRHPQDGPPSPKKGPP